MTRQEQVIWAAGFFDGEGCISISRSNPRPQIYHYHLHYNLSLGAFQSCRAPLDILQTLFGGTVRVDQKLKGWRWRLGNSNAIQVLEELTPFLVVKKAQAQTALGFQRRKTTVGGRYADPVAAREHDERDYQLMKAQKLVLLEV